MKVGLNQSRYGPSTVIHSTRQQNARQTCPKLHTNANYKCTPTAGSFNLPGGEGWSRPTPPSLFSHLTNAMPACSMCVCRGCPYKQFQQARATQYNSLTARLTSDCSETRRMARRSRENRSMRHRSPRHRCNAIAIASRARHPAARPPSAPHSTAVPRCPHHNLPGTHFRPERLPWVHRRESPTEHTKVRHSDPRSSSAH